MKNTTKNIANAIIMLIIHINRGGTIKMKTWEEHVAEIAVIGCVRNPKAHTVEECMKCEFKDGSCNAYRHAEYLYSAGYRKQSDTVREVINRLFNLSKEQAKNGIYTIMSWIDNAKKVATEYGVEVEE